MMLWSCYPPLVFISIPSSSSYFISVFGTLFRLLLILYNNTVPVPTHPDWEVRKNPSFLPSFVFTCVIKCSFLLFWFQSILLSFFRSFLPSSVFFMKLMLCNVILRKWGFKFCAQSVLVVVLKNNNSIVYEFYAYEMRQPFFHL